MYSEIFLPENAPSEWQNRQGRWHEMCSAPLQLNLLFFPKRETLLTIVILDLALYWMYDGIIITIEGDNTVMKYGVVFDVEGTLNQTVLYGVEVYQKALKKRNIYVSEQNIIPIIELSPEAIVKWFFGSLTKEEYDEWMEDVERTEAELMKNKAKPFHGVPVVLEQLKKQGYTLMICSNAYPMHIENILSVLNIRQYFDYVGSLQIGTDKTAVLAELIQQSGCDRVYMVGDRKFDIEAAKNNGVPSIGCAYGYAPEEVRKADYVIHAPLELLTIVDRLRREERNLM